ncbi:Hcp family type VI secretion system effector [Paragemmobacter straminiformis]|uniref:Type VI secretion system tube protein Hcp n=1 Tax=Paragemmobacter straminiformis TaxID=2045119 RepID=A0A842I9X1_9RHOB|nr:type VI secretion system tube protein Hcp [Gemmobacter straminiformis]MBC2836435.1 type VI secretion system tube protein Hcp [Gemmobacter straminiformis]
MAFDAFCYCATKPKDRHFLGETQDDFMSKLGAFEIISFELGAENTINIGSMSSGGGAGKATFKEFTITKKTDTASTALFGALCLGTHFDDVVVELRRSGTASRTDQLFMRFTMKMVLVQDISWSGSDGDDVCEETVIMQYGAIKIEYIPQKKDGAHDMGKKSETKWNRVRNLATDDI